VHRWAEVDLLEGPWKYQYLAHVQPSSRLQVFLLFDTVEREQWSQKLAESRDAYSALRAHFLKYIEHPDDLESTVDPLADDEEVCQYFF
jgi:hypothetical protein